MPVKSTWPKTLWQWIFHAQNKSESKESQENYELYNVKAVKLSNVIFELFTKNCHYFCIHQQIPSVFDVMYNGVVLLSEMKMMESTPTHLANKMKNNKKRLGKDNFEK